MRFFEGTIALTFALIFAAFLVFPLWRIAKKMGYPGFIGIMALIPVVNILLAYILAFKQWPALRRRSN
jgi:hypothetical protein